jgi:putative transposase
VQFGHARYVWNSALVLRRDAYRERQESNSFYDLKRRMTALKAEAEHVWLREADSQVLQAKVEDLERAYCHFFAGRARFPRFKRKDGPQSIRYPQRFRFKEGRLYLPNVGWVKTTFHRAMEGTPKNVTVSRTTSGYYNVSVQCEREITPAPHPGPIVGVDLGLTHLAILSTGEKVEHPWYLRRAERRLARLQRSLSRKRRGGQNRERARRRVARQHERVANSRHDTLHKLSHRLVRDFGTIRLESLNVRGLLRNRRLARSVADSGWGLLVELCRYKATWRGGTVEQIDRFYPSSRTCHVCGDRNKALTLADRAWACAACGTQHDRDINAARVIASAPTAGAAGRQSAGRSRQTPGLFDRRGGRGTAKPNR